MKQACSQNRHTSDASEQPQKTSKYGVALLCLLIVICGQLWLLRATISPTDMAALPPCFVAEAFFMLLFAVGLVFMHRHPKALLKKSALTVTFAVFGLYAVMNVLLYPSFADAYQAGCDFQYPSAAGALVALKVVLILTGIIAAIPASPKIDNREYARRLKEKVHKQDAEWAAASLKATKTELDKTVQNLKQSLSEEELQILMQKLREEAPEVSADDSSTISMLTDPDSHWGKGV